MTPFIASVFAEEGTSVALPCHLPEQGQKEDWRMSLRWSREGRTMLLLEQSGMIKRGQLLLRRAMIREALFHKGDFALYIQPVQYTDAGLYTGHVQYRGLSVQCLVLLHVTKVTAVPSGGLPQTDRVSLTCASTDPEKEEEVRWYHKGHKKSLSRTIVLRGKELTIEPLSMQDAGDWRCELLYKNGKTSASYRLQVLGFSQEDSNPSTTYAAVGSSSELPCHLSSFTDVGAGAVAVSWSRMQSLPSPDPAIPGSNSWPSRFSPLQGKKQNFSLQISGVQEGDAGLYHCSFTFHGRTLTRKVTLVTMKVSSSRTGLIREGSWLQLTCDLSDPSGVGRYEGHIWSCQWGMRVRRRSGAAEHLAGCMRAGPWSWSRSLHRMLAPGCAPSTCRTGFWGR
ncbi:lymphocyte activation gene 3 protein isoform X2 [Rhinatrema bivittatum]|nr:lymphocyte activation gene 3 protein isoform X2 [Rhinatrema bivittatum]